MSSRDVPRGPRDNVLAAMERVREFSRSAFNGDHSTQGRLLHILESIEAGVITGKIQPEESFGQIHRAKNFARQSGRSSDINFCMVLTSLDQLEERLTEYLAEMR